MLHQLSEWLKVGKCVRVEEGTSGMSKMKMFLSILFTDSMFYSLSCFPSLISHHHHPPPPPFLLPSNYVPDLLGARNSDVQSSLMKGRQVNKWNTKVFNKEYTDREVMQKRAINVTRKLQCQGRLHGSSNDAFWRQARSLPHL